MKARLLLALVLGLCAACNESGGSKAGSDSAARAPTLPDPSDPTASLKVASTGEGCSTEWQLEPVTVERLRQRVRETMDTAVGAASGIDNMTAAQIPYLNLEIGSAVPISCVIPAFVAMQETGYSRVGLRLDEPSRYWHFAYFPLTQVGAAAPSVRLEIGSDGRMTWNGQSVDAAVLGQRVQTLRTGAPPPAERGEIVIVATPQTRFSAVYEALSAVRMAGMEADLGLPTTPAA